MKTKFRILHLEDSRTDCALVHDLLKDDGLDCDIVQCDDREKYIADLKADGFDLIFADCTLPQFNGLHALELARKLAPGTPFIFVSGTLDEDIAIESLRSGATDYVLKHRLSRLVPAVRRALAEAEERAKNYAMEQQLRQSQRLEAVGTLAGGIAHDFNNILTIIKSYTSLLPMECDQPDRVLDISATIDRASTRGAELVNQLLAFARKSDGAFTSTDLNQRVREIAEMLRPSMPDNIVFELRLTENLPEIHADPGQVERVLINLVTNARDASPNGGTIAFATGRIPVGETPLRSGHDAEEYICLQVTDTGSGMDEATRQRIFEPFFTTKPRGKGTGLGMPVVYGLMQSHNGFIDVQSELGRGTTIALYFPVPRGPMPKQIERPSIAPRALEGTETILIVDDEADVRYFVDMVLSGRGYKVLATGDPGEALDILSNHPGDIHVLFTDVGLPGVDGFELHHRARELRPGAKTILCSGYSDATLKARMNEEGINGFIPKPYDATSLLQSIRSIIDKPAT